MKRKMKIAMLLVVMLSIGMLSATFALFHQNTELKENVFTASSGLSISLREPSWDGYDFDDKVPGIPGTQKNPESKDTSLGIDLAQQYMPGDHIKKDPTLKNEQGSENAWVAIKVEFYNHDGTLISQEQFEKEYGMITINDKFTLIEANTKYSLYAYNDILKAGDKSEALFNEVVVNEDIAFVKGGLPSFKVKTSGYAVQSKGVNKEKALKQFKTMMN